MPCGLFSAQRGVQEHFTSRTAVANLQSWLTYNRKILQMSFISQTKVLLVNIFFGNMIRWNKFHHDCQCLKIKFSLKVQMTGQLVQSSTDLSGQCSILTGHCPLTGCYFKPWYLATSGTNAAGSVQSWKWSGMSPFDQLALIPVTDTAAKWEMYSVVFFLIAIRCHTADGVLWWWRSIWPVDRHRLSLWCKASCTKME